ncbi:HAD-IA family hydrolase [Marivibrio halodurans]|uniref:HAD-IA family hydrolase n=1 Tax=Marivibrio halodurans TaxID=2039722 RepID=A0A8J7S000_9PROT|nr:HAD-IA family hydrolase [Marivibrio halodurans]MBP5856168.1 HAD-IA family hydrolase [Marivibrio halodurans]
MTDRPLRLAVFDCDGTLVDSGHIIVAAMTAAWAVEGLPAPDHAAIRHQVGLPLVEAIANVVPEHGDVVHRRLAEHYKDVFHSGRVEGLHDEPLFPGCREVLDELAGEGVILAIATGKGRRGLKSTLDRHGIGHHFTILKTADDGPGKPNPDILLDAMAEVGAEPWNTVMIGDTIFDVTMAVRARAKAVGVGWGYHPPEELRRAGAHALARGYDELPRLLRGLWGDE